MKLAQKRQVTPSPVTDCMYAQPRMTNNLIKMYQSMHLEFAKHCVGQSSRENTWLAYLFDSVIGHILCGKNKVYP